MKKIIVCLIVLILCPIMLDALSYRDYDNSIETVNNYINSYTDRNKYLIFKKNYDFREGTSKYHSSFEYGGLLSKEEYELSVLNNDSYLANGKEYWTLTESGENQWYIDATIGLKNRGESSGVRVSEFVNNATQVSGKGTYENPWVFINNYSIEVKPDSISRGDVTPKKQTVEPGYNSENIIVSESDAYMYSSNDCGLTKMGYTSDDKIIFRLNNVRKDYNCTINFEKRKIQVTYDCNGGTGSTASQIFEYDKNYTLNNSGCSKIGYTQTSWITSNNQTWNLNENGTWAYSNKQRGIENNNLSLKAKWKANTYSVSFNANGGSGGQSSTVAATYASSMPSISTTKPTRSGYTFQGWYDNQTYTSGTQYYTASCVSARTWNKTANTTLYAGWKDDVKPTITLGSTSLTKTLGVSYTLLDNATISDASGIKSKGAYINNNLVANTSGLSAGTYTVVYKAEDNNGNKQEVNCSLTIAPANYDFAYTGSEVDWTVPATGTYRFTMYGAQGAGSGGKGGYVQANISLTAGQTYKVAIGGQNGFNGGGVQSGTSNGGGPTTVRQGSTYLLIAAGGGGGSAGTAGGSGTGAGGSRPTGGTAGTAGTNGGGGSSSTTGERERCSTCTKCVLYNKYCASWGPNNGSGYCNGCTGSSCCCLRYENTDQCLSEQEYECNCRTVTVSARGGQGGSSVTPANATNVTKTDGQREGNGSLKIEFVP